MPRAIVNECRPKGSPCAADVVSTRKRRLPHLATNRIEQVATCETCVEMRQARCRMNRGRLWEEPPFARQRVTTWRTGSRFRRLSRSWGDDRVARAANSTGETVGVMPVRETPKSISSSSAICTVSVERSASPHGCSGRARCVIPERDATPWPLRNTERTGVGHVTIRRLPYMYPQEYTHDGATFFATRL